MAGLVPAIHVFAEETWMPGTRAGHDEDEKGESQKMPIAGMGMLLTSMDVDGTDEEEFNRWYDREHLEERVAIEGFLEARRYLAHTGSPKFLFLYSTKTIEVLDSPAYRARLSNPTEWSQKIMARFKNMIRVVARITASRGVGRGAVLGIVRLRPQAGKEAALSAELKTRLEPDLDGIISMHLLEGDAKLSGPTAEIPTAGSGAADWFVLIDGTNVPAVSSSLAARFSDTAIPAGATLVSSGIYNLLWDLAKSDMA
jgi:hypothetical protein